LGEGEASCEKIGEGEIIKRKGKSIEKEWGTNASGHTSALWQMAAKEKCSYRSRLSIEIEKKGGEERSYQRREKN